MISRMLFLDRIILRSIFSFFFSSRRRHTRLTCDWSSDVCSSDLSQQRLRLPNERVLPLNQRGLGNCLGFSQVTAEEATRPLRLGLRRVLRVRILGVSNR